MFTSKNSGNHKGFALRRAAVALALLLSTCLVSAKKYISDVMLIGGSKSEVEALKTKYKAEGWSVIDYDLNKSISDADWVYLLYKYVNVGSDDRNYRYITDLYLSNVSAANAHPQFSVNNKTYYLVPYDGGCHFKEQKGDLNSGTGKNTDAIHLYYSKTALSSEFKVVSDIWFNDTKSGAVGKNGGSSGYDLNAGCGIGTDYIYMHISTESAQPAFHIFFDKNADDAVGEMEPQSLLYRDDQYLSTCKYTRPRYVFKKWNSNSAGTGVSYADGELYSSYGEYDDFTIYAQWEKYESFITYIDAQDGVDGVKNPNPTSYRYNGPDVTLVPPTRRFYTFAGWTYDNQTVPVMEVTIDGKQFVDRTFKAHWTLNDTIVAKPEDGLIRMTDGQIITGTGGTSTYISIEGGATVTLFGLNLATFTDADMREYGSIICEGDATIIVADGTESMVKGFGYYPGIYIPHGNTLTIRGGKDNDGSLIAMSHMNDFYDYGDSLQFFCTAGIGGSSYLSCGNIHIEGGIITAIGEEGCPGIGSGQNSYCGTIVITEGVNSVSVVRGKGSPDYIGAGLNGRCDGVYISDKLLSTSKDDTMALYHDPLEQTEVTSTITEPVETGIWHDLLGRELEQAPTEKGVYFLNGVKYIIL